jgi:hypothetical protein
MKPYDVLRTAAAKGFSHTSCCFGDSNSCRQAVVLSVQMLYVLRAAVGQTETSKSEWSTSVRPPAADLDQRSGLVSFVPTADSPHARPRLVLVVSLRPVVATGLVGGVGPEMTRPLGPKKHRADPLNEASHMLLELDRLRDERRAASPELRR